MPRSDPAAFAARWRTYFAERFPPAQHGLLIAVFVFGVMQYSARAGAAPGGTGAGAYGVAFVTAFLIILQLRTLDEFKDYDEDARWRPYRPVPRGLVSLRGLRNLGIAAAGVQTGAALLLDWRLLAGLVAIWAYAGLMGVEFFVRRWLKAHALTYMASHIVIVPMIAAYVAACQWLPAAGAAPALGWLLAASYFTFCVIEVGRKIRAPSDEEPGVETYSALWGLRRAVFGWLAFILMSGGCAVRAAWAVHAAVPVGAALIVVLGAAMALTRAFIRRPLPNAGKRFQLVSGLWTLALFGSIGLGATVAGSGWW